MMSDSAVPVYTRDEAYARETFLALMWALSYPGQMQLLPGAAVNGLALVGAALLDLQTTYFTPDSALADQMKHSGARRVASERAAYHFYPEVDAVALNHIVSANSGTAQFPDEGATLVLGADFGAGLALTLRGPGINGTQAILVSGIPEAFWKLRAKVGLYPRGWDVFLVDRSAHVIGLPRTTRISGFED